MQAQPSIPRTRLQEQKSEDKTVTSGQPEQESRNRVRQNRNPNKTAGETSQDRTAEHNSSQTGWLVQESQDKT
jgi:hypothetical protein